MSDAPSLRLHTDPDVTPTAIYTPSVVPCHWVNDVKAGLDRDVRLGVLERVPVNEAVTWTLSLIHI